MPTIDDVKKAICCPKGCVRLGDCWAKTMDVCRRGAPEAIMELFAGKDIEIAHLQERLLEEMVNRTIDG